MINRSLLALLGGVACRVYHGRDTHNGAGDEDLCQASLWDEWIDTLDCMWQNPDEQWWLIPGKVGHARGTDQWDAWNTEQTSKMANEYTKFQASYYYDQYHQKVCDPNGNLLSIGKITGDTVLADCNNPSNITGTFTDLRHQDARSATMITAINFAAIYDDKTRQGSDAAAAEGHPDWSYGEYYNYDHLPAKSTYPDSCDGHDGDKLPTVAIQAVDHKGPVWTYCTTSRSSSSDNDRKSIAKMIAYSAAGEYGRSIFENLDCLLSGAINMDMTTTFTDYIVGFKNLMYLHYEANTINQGERDILLSYLTLAASSPTDAINNVEYFDGMLKDANTDLTPLFC